MPKAPPVPSSPLQSSPPLDLTRPAAERDFAVAYRRPLFARMVEFQIIQGELAMRGFGIFVLIAGIACLIYAIGMDISVPTGLGRVNNLGLMSDRSNLTLTGGIITIAGLLMVIRWRKTSQPEPPKAVDTRACPFCAETIKAAAVRCRFCGADTSSSAAPRATGPSSGWTVRVECSSIEGLENANARFSELGLTTLPPENLIARCGYFEDKADAQVATRDLASRYRLESRVKQEPA